MPTSSTSSTSIESLLDSLPPILEGEQAFADGDLARAVERFTTALERDPHSMRARCNLGVVLFASGDAKGALEAFDDVLRRDPRNAGGWFNKAQILVAENRLREGAAALRACLAAAPDDAAARGLLEALDLPRPGGSSKASTPCAALDPELTAALEAHGDDPAEASERAATPRLSIVFTCRGDLSEALAFLDALQLEFPAPELLEVFVVDERADAERAHPLDALDARFPLHHIAHATEEARHGWALGAERASAEAVLFLEAGALPDASGLRAHLLAALRSEDAGWAPIGESPAAGLNHARPQGSNLRLPLGQARTLAQEYPNLPLQTALDRAVQAGRLPAPKALGREFRLDGVGPLERPVFLFGCAYRSGSTFLQRLISSSEEVFVWGENMAVTRPLVSLADQVRAWDFERFQEEQWRDFEQKGLAGWICALQPKPFPELAQRALRAFYLEYYATETQALGASRWGFKEVHHGGREAQLLLELFPAGRVVFVVRNPVDVLASTAGADWYDRVGPAERVLELWRDNTRTMLDLDDERVLVLRYEQFVEQPERHLERLAEHLSLPLDAFDRELLQRKVRGNFGAPQLGAAERAALSKPAFRRAARELGYDVTAHPSLGEAARQELRSGAAPVRVGPAPSSLAPTLPADARAAERAPAGPPSEAPVPGTAPLEAVAAASARDVLTGASLLERLRAAGLRSDHALLDLCCGSLEHSGELLEYLNRGHYLGLEHESTPIENALQHRLPRELDRRKRPDLQVQPGFDCSHFRQAPSHVLATDRFLALGPDEMQRALEQVAAVAPEHGRLFVTGHGLDPNGSDPPSASPLPRLERAAGAAGWQRVAGPEATWLEFRRAA